MRAVVQRVSSARVSIGGREHTSIGRGLLVLVGVEKNDTESDAATLAKKIVELRVFEDDSGRMNRSLLEVEGEVLAVSQFTLLGDSQKGRRPSFEKAAPPEEARRLYELFVATVDRAGVEVSTGVFRGMMDVELTNNGPVTLLLDTRKAF
jgi:D-tyrosyl-tRNA(Tyr) deacylase